MQNMILILRHYLQQGFTICTNKIYYVQTPKVF